MFDMLYDAVAGIGTVTNGKLDLHVDLVGAGSGGTVKEYRYNVYIRVIKKSYLHFFFRVTTPPPGPWPATLATPEGEKFENINSEPELQKAIEQVIQRPWTNDVVRMLLQMDPP